MFATSGIDCKFGVIIGDMILKGYKRRNIVDPYNLTYKYKAFRNYLNIIERQDIDPNSFPCTQKLIANTLVKYYLDVFTDIIYKTFSNVDDNF